ncbi:hypothetical protein GTU99_31565, partial [Streptomyces sp. PRKS01-65]
TATPAPTPPAASAPPPAPSANHPAPAGGGGGGGSLANTGVPGLAELIGVVGLLVGAGLMIAFVTRNRHARHH